MDKSNLKKKKLIKKERKIKRTRAVSIADENKIKEREVPWSIIKGAGIEG